MPVKRLIYVAVAVRAARSDGLRLREPGKAQKSISKLCGVGSLLFWNALSDTSLKINQVVVCTIPEVCRLNQSTRIQTALAMPKIPRIAPIRMSRSRWSAMWPYEIDPVVAKIVLRKIDIYFTPGMLIGKIDDMFHD